VVKELIMGLVEYEELVLLGKFCTKKNTEKRDKV
jgi:hypothetical protein